MSLLHPSEELRNFSLSICLFIEHQNGCLPGSIAKGCLTPAREGSERMSTPGQHLKSKTSTFNCAHHDFYITEFSVK